MENVVILETNNTEVLSDIEKILTNDFGIMYCAINIFSNIAVNGGIEEERLDKIKRLNKNIIVIDEAYGESILDSNHITYSKIISKGLSLDELAEEIILCLN